MGKHRKNPDRPQPDYEIGYGVPPDKHKFQPGHKGFGPRLKKVVDFHEELGNALTSTTTVSVDGHDQKMTFIELAARRTVAQFAKDPGKYLKTLGPDIQKALHLRNEMAAQAKPDIDFAAPFREKIEAMARRFEADREGVKNLPPELRPDDADK